MKIEEVLNRMVEVQHRITINEAVIYCLEQYLPGDTTDAPPKELLVQDHCLVPIVPDTAFEAVLDEMYGQNKLLDQELVGLKERETHERPEQERDGGGEAGDGGAGGDAKAEDRGKPRVTKGKKAKRHKGKPGAEAAPDGGAGS
ncbi:MAG: hypothetical protein HN396_17630 [Gemmatimonadales bacterium]|nr:hypothetical protein [Gemmatimonadales bacterium]